VILQVLSASPNVQASVSPRSCCIRRSDACHSLA
jgi:hypothetical protein